MADGTAISPRGLNLRYINRRVSMPYGLTVFQVAEGTRETYRLVDGINSYLVRDGFEALEKLVPGNSFSGLISEFLVKNIARASTTLVANQKVGGHPDLLPKHKCPSGTSLKGTAGIEVKTSMQRGGWQGHNPEKGWVLVFRYSCGRQADSTAMPLTFVEIMAALLQKEDWSYSGRKGASRRTPTASITCSGVEKLRTNFLYRLPDVGVGRHRSILAENCDSEE